MHICPKCKTEFGGKFCPECGYEWVEEKYCMFCGAKNKGSARFCEECGRSLTQEPTTQSEQRHQAQAENLEWWQLPADTESPTQQRHQAQAESLEWWQQPADTKRPTQQRPQPQAMRAAKIKAQDRPSMLYSAVKLVPIAMLLLFSLLMLIFFSVNVAVRPSTKVMGVSVPAQPYGSIYGEALDTVPEITGVAVALIVFTALALLYAIICVSTLFVKRLKNKRSLFLGKYDIPFCEMLGILSPIVYAIFIILGSVLMGELSSLDGGSGLIEIAAYPKLILAFSIIFFVISLAISILRIVKYQAFLKQGGGMSAERKAELKGFYAIHEKPVKPAAVAKPVKGANSKAEKSAYGKYKKEAQAYYFDKHRYDNGKEGKTPAAVIWLSLNKTKILIVSIIVAVFVVLLATLIPYANNIFRTGKVEQIRLGMSENVVVYYLGEPYDKKDIKSKSDDISGGGIIDSLEKDEASDLATVRWRYFDSSYAKARKEAEMQLENIGFKGGIDAIISGGLGGLTGVSSSMAAVISPLLGKVYDYIQVDFDKNGNVVNVLFEKSRCDGIDSKNRKVDELKFRSADDVHDWLDAEKRRIPSLQYYEDFTDAQNKGGIVHAEKLFWYSAYLDGGSFARGYVQDFQLKDKINEDKIKVTWKDGLAEYSCNRDAVRLGYVESDGKWINKDKISDDIDYLPNSVKAISDNSFRDAKIKSIVIPDSVTSIGNNAFYNCRYLKCMDIPKSVVSVGEYAFSGCEELTAIYCEAVGKPEGWNGNWNNGSYPVYWRCKTVNGIRYSTKSSGSRTEAVAVGVQDKDIENAVIPETVDFGGFVSFYNVTEIAPNAFEDCKKLKSIEIPNGVTSIGERAFYNCERLNSILLPSTVTAIGDRAFDNCDSVHFIYIPESVVEMGDYVFMNYNNISVCCAILSQPDTWSANWHNGSGVKVFWNCAENDGITYGLNYGDSTSAWAIHGKVAGEVQIASEYQSYGVIGIASHAFSDCDGLQSITIPNSVTSIGDYAFSDCGGLKSITIPSSVTSIGDHVFYDCDGLNSIKIPNSVTKIGYGAFENCDGLKSITIPNSVTDIGNYAFSDCERLECITVPNSVKVIGENAFYNNLNLYDIIYKGTKAEWNSKFNKLWFSRRTTITCTDGTLTNRRFEGIGWFWSLIIVLTVIILFIVLLVVLIVVIRKRKRKKRMQNNNNRTL